MSRFTWSVLLALFAVAIFGASDASARSRCRGYYGPAVVYYYVVPVTANARVAGPYAEEQERGSQTERYFYVPPTGASAATPRQSARPPRLWQPGDGDPGLTHTVE